MTVEVLLPGVLADDAAGNRRVDVEVGDGARVADVLDALAGAHPRLGRRLRDEAGAVRRHVNLFLDGEDVRRAGGLAMPAPDGATLLVLPSVAGG